MNRRPAPPRVVDCFGLSHVGRVRPGNEDQFLIADLSRFQAVLHTSCSPDEHADSPTRAGADLFLVADGVGGHAGGERASRLAVEGVVEYLHRSRTPLEDKDGIGDKLESALLAAQEALREDAEDHDEYSRMGTTLTLALVSGSAVQIAHAGDSRAYLYDGQRLRQLTRDQTLVQMLADRGVIDAALVECHPLRHILASLICPDRQQLQPQVCTHPLAPWNQLLLCTDGLTKHVSAREIVQVLDDAVSAEAACRELVAAANRAGGTDNVTVVLARLGASGARSGVEKGRDDLKGR